MNPFFPPNCYTTPQPISPTFAPNPADPCALSALEQARRIASGQLTSEELVERYLARIEAHEARLGAFTHVQADSARRQARRADRLRRSGGHLPPFLGVPTAVKDHYMVRFWRTQIGSRAFRWLVAPKDDIIVRQLRQAGFVLVGHTTMSELGILPTVETEIGPPTRNPWDLHYTAGGSSGGAGASVGAGLLPIAPGSDGAGSVRIPAALNGLFGLKPSRGAALDPSPRVNRFGFVSAGPLARSLADTAALFDVLAARSVGATSARAARPIPQLRIALVTTPPFGESDPRIIEVVERAAERLRSVGHLVEPVEGLRVDLSEFTPLYQRMVSCIPIPKRSALSPFARWFVEAGRQLNDADAWRRVQRFTQLAERAQMGFDLVLSPTIGALPPKIGAFSQLSPPEMFEAYSYMGAFTAIANVTGQPALTIPYGQVEGLPVGVQLMGRQSDEARLFHLGRQLCEGPGAGVGNF